MRTNIHREDAAHIIIDLPGSRQHMLSGEVVFKQIASAFKGGRLMYGGRTEIRIDPDGRVFLNGEMIFEPRGLVQLELSEG